VDGRYASVHLEAGLPASSVEELRRRVHPLTPWVAGYARALFGRGQIIRRDPGGALAGGSDSRADGAALGDP
jgi:gamma-glutamyltranspeptidase/glutathione hydrolase